MQRKLLAALRWEYKGIIRSFSFSRGNFSLEISSQLSCIILLFEVKDSSDYLGPDVSSPVMDSGHYGQYLSEAIVLDLSGHLAGSRELVSECGHKIIKNNSNWPGRGSLGSQTFSRGRWLRLPAACWWWSPRPWRRGSQREPSACSRQLQGSCWSHRISWALGTLARPCGSWCRGGRAPRCTWTGPRSWRRRHWGPEVLPLRGIWRWRLPCWTATGGLLSADCPRKHQPRIVSRLGNSLRSWDSLIQYPRRDLNLVLINKVRAHLHLDTSCHPRNVPQWHHFYGVSWVNILEQTKYPATLLFGCPGQHCYHRSVCQTTEVNLAGLSFKVDIQTFSNSLISKLSVTRVTPLCCAVSSHWTTCLAGRSNTNQTVWSLKLQHTSEVITITFIQWNFELNYLFPIPNLRDIYKVREGDIWPNI